VLPRCLLHNLAQMASGRDVVGAGSRALAVVAGFGAATLGYLHGCAPRSAAATSLRRW
jgi:hypothetical protein